MGKNGRRDAQAPPPPAFVWLRFGGAHGPARLCAAAADFSDFVVTKFFARLGAVLANVRARTASNMMKPRMTQHKVMRDVAHLCTIHQYAYVMGVRVLAALLEAVVDFVKTGIVTLFTIVDAFMHLRALVFMNV